MKAPFPKLFFTFFALFPAAGLAQGGQPPENSSSLAQSLTAKSGEVHSLRKSKNISGLKSLLAGDFQYVGCEGKLHQLSELVDDTQDGLLRDFKLYDPRVVPIDAATALVTYNVVLEMREGDEPGMAPRYQKISDLWIRHGDDWRLKFEQATPLRPID